jgi:hypothetical protein
MDKLKELLSFASMECLIAFRELLTEERKGSLLAYLLRNFRA